MSGEHSASVFRTDVLLPCRQRQWVALTHYYPLTRLWYPTRPQYVPSIRWKQWIPYFDVLLTVHLSIFISVFNQLDVQNLFHNKFYFMPLHVSSICAHHQEEFLLPDEERMCSKHVEIWNTTYCETNFVHQVG